MTGTQTCPFCSATISGLVKVCTNCHRPLPASAEGILDESGRQLVIVKEYKGNRDTITAQFQHDMPLVLAQGYRLEHQQLIPGKRGGCLALLGILTLGILFLVVRPKDTLIVTYRLQDKANPPTAP